MSRTGRPAMERWIAKVDTVSTPRGCWLWTGTMHQSGYGQFTYQGRQWYAHDWGYRQIVGPIPSGLELDHLCRNRRCVRPAHLDPVTHGENMRRGMSPAMVTKRTGVCGRGHSMADAIVVRRNGLVTGSACRSCTHERSKAAYRRRKAAL